MFSSFLRPILSSALAVLTLLLAPLSPAHATYVVGVWDPQFGTPFTNLGWRGTTTLWVPDTCLAVPGIVLNNGIFCSLMSVTSASVEFYDITDPFKTTVETLNFSGNVGVNLVNVNGSNQVDGFALQSTGLVVSTHPLAITGGDQALFALELAYNAGQTTALLYWTTDLVSGLLGRNDNDRFPALVRITTLSVPEPGTLALVAAALGGLGWSRRRRQA